MKYFLLFYIFLFSQARAAESIASATAIKQLLMATNAKKNFEETIQKSSQDGAQELKDTLILEVAKELKGKAVNPLQGNVVKNKVKEILKISNPSNMWEILEPSLIKLYKDNFTDSEVNAILTFYKTPAGVALLVKMPKINIGSLGVVERLTENTNIKVRKIIDEGINEIRSQELK